MKPRSRLILLGAFCLLSLSAAGASNIWRAQAAVVTAPLPERQEDLPPGVSIQTLLTGMQDPVAMAFDPQGRLFYTEKDTGNVRLFANGALQPNAVINFKVDSTNERGLLGIAIDPNFDQNHFIYVFYSCAVGPGCSTLENRVARFVENNGAGSNPTTIFTIPQTADHHNGGNIHFGPDGKLYITVGDNADPANSQNVSTKNGKMHRINPDGTIPTDNPVFTQTGALPSLYAIGLRNSFDFTFDPVVTGRIFATENGPDCNDEMNRIEAGYNYGWRPNYPCDDDNPDPEYNTISPLWWVPAAQCCPVPTGIAVYTGNLIPEWHNDLFMSTYESPGRLYHFYLNADRTSLNAVGIVRGVTTGLDIETGPDGALWYMEGGGNGTGTLKKLVGSGEVPTPTQAPTSANPTAAPTQAPNPSVTATAPAANGTPAIPGSGSVSFPATGKSATGIFLDYWNNNGGLQQQGYPISDLMNEVSDLDGKPYVVQYFERAVFEYHPENQPPFNVLLSQLGTFRYHEKYPNGAPGQQPNTGPGAVLFPETGKHLGGRFLQYWQEHGGLVQQGYPISDEFTEVSDVDGKPYVVQYFERAVFELHPDNEAPYDILLSLLGSIQYSQRYAGQHEPEPTSTPLPPPSGREVGGDWPMYGHDPQHTSYNPDESLISLDNVGQLMPRWQVLLGSNENPSSSTPSVAGGRVYVGGSVSSGPNFFAFDANSGTRVWSADLGYVADCEKVGIGSTAAISGTVLAVGGGDGSYYGLNAQTGAALWREELNAGTSGFAWESPLLAGDRAYLGVASYCDNPSVRGEIRAVDMLSGQVLARQYIVPAGKAGGGIWNSPALSPDGSVLAVATGEDTHGYNGPYNRALVTLDPLSLDIMQHNQQGLTGSDLDFASSPVIFHDRSNRLLVGASHKDNQFYAYDLGNINQGPVWSRRAKFSIGMLAGYDPTVGDGGTLFLTGLDGVLYTVDPATGADIRPPANVGQLHGNLAIANGLLFADAGVDGLSIYNDRDGQLLRTLMPDHAGNGFSGVAVAHGFIYWVSGGYLNAWSLP